MKANIIVYNRVLNNYCVVTEDNQPVADGSYQGMEQLCRQVGIDYYVASTDEYHYNLSRRQLFRFTTEGGRRVDHAVTVSSFISMMAEEERMAENYGGSEV